MASRSRIRNSEHSQLAGRSDLFTKTLLSSVLTFGANGVAPAAIQAFAASVGPAEHTCWRCTVAPVTGEQAEQLTDVLLSFGAQSVVVQEYRPPGEEEQELFGNEDNRLWDRCTVLAHFALEHDVEHSFAVARDILEAPELTYQQEPVVNEEWVEQIKASYVPLRVTDSLYIIPDWSEPIDPHATNIVLQPGVAFGTGEHATTRLCLQQLQRTPLTGSTVMDYGTGSGVLGIAALLMGAAWAVGVDTDPLAVRAAQTNAGLNGSARSFQALRCSPELEGPEPLEQIGQSGRQFDVVVANILRGPLLELEPRLARYAKPGGLLLLSGILTEQVPDIQASYQEHFEQFEVRGEGTWALITAVRKAD